MKRPNAQSFSLLLFAGSVMYAKEAAAQTSYTLLEKLPGIGEKVALDAGGLTNYLQTLFNLGIGIAVALAVVMIVIGGAQYLSTDALTGKTEGRSKLAHAVGGLILALGVFIILNTVNPDILKINLDLKSSLRRVGKVDTGALIAEEKKKETATPAWWDQRRLDLIIKDEQAKRTLITNTNANIDINNGGIGRGWCTSFGQKNCTSVGGLPAVVITRLSALQKGCACPIVITGGTEWWSHSSNTTHGPSSPVVDIRKTPELENYLRRTLSLSALEIGKTYTVRFPGAAWGGSGGGNFFNEDAAHFHVTFF